MRKKWLLAVVVVLVMIIGTALVLSRDKVVEVGESDNNQTVSLVKGDRLLVSLPSNPSTGYSWYYTSEPVAEVLQETRQWYEAKSDLIGGGGVYHWEYTAAGIGSTSISLAYSRPWENGQPLKTYTLNVKVVSRVERFKSLLSYNNFNQSKKTSISPLLGIIITAGIRG